MKSPQSSIWYSKDQDYKSAQQQGDMHVFSLPIEVHAMNHNWIIIKILPFSYSQSPMLHLLSQNYRYRSYYVDDKKFYLSFCLPKVLGLFHEEQVEPAQHYSSEQQSNIQLQSSRMKDVDQEKVCKFPVQKKSFFSVACHISLLDLQMKPIAPWIRQNTCGVIFTENLINQSVDLNSERVQKRKQKADDAKEEGKKNKKQRYNEYESK